MSIKGDWPRPLRTTREENELRKAYAWGEMTLKEFNRKYRELKAQGLIKRL